MTVETTSLLNMALLSEASYVLFDKVANTSDNALLIEALTNQRNFNGAFSFTQATEFVENWSVRHHEPNTSSGFSASLFYSASENRYVYAIRGTEPEAFVNSADLAADVGDIVVDGLAAA